MMIDRLIERKSLVDIAMTVEVSKAVCQGCADGVIVVSSDSDFYPLLELPAEFIFMYERNNTSNVLKEALRENGNLYFPLDIFNTAGIEQYLHDVLIGIVEKQLEKMEMQQLNTLEIVKQAYAKVRYEASTAEMQRFHDHYVKKRVRVDENGNLYLVA